MVMNFFEFFMNSGNFKFEKIFYPQFSNNFFLQIHIFFSLFKCASMYGEVHEKPTFLFYILYSMAENAFRTFRDVCMQAFGAENQPFYVPYPTL